MEAIQYYALFIVMWSLSDIGRFTAEQDVQQSQQTIIPIGRERRYWDIEHICGVKMCWRVIAV
jgi:hypothetical protein